MKKAVCLCLALLMLLPSAGLASGIIPNLREDASTPAPAIFSFRAGVHWNMTRELVRALEVVELSERSSEGWSILFPLAPVEVSKFTAELVYMFYNDRLKMIIYDFVGGGYTNTDYQYLTGALDSVYGEHTEPPASAIIGVMDQIYSGYYSVENLRNIRGWTYGDDTLIYLFYSSENVFSILYVNAGSSGPLSYVTTGL